MSESQDIETATTAIESPILDGRPDSKTRRYDRQLRLWAASGQSALEQTHLLVLPSSALSSQILKNLVLPGVGSFTILDPEETTQADLGNNFFLDPHTSLNRPRAEEGVRLLCEMNEDVRGYADLGSTSSAEIKSRAGWVADTFGMVIAVNAPRETVDVLSEVLWSTDVPLVIVRSAGFVAEFFLQLNEHPVVETHSETAPSLRLDAPFPALRTAADALDWDGMDSTDHSHVPYVLILARALGVWEREHCGQPPKTYAEKQEFKAQVRAMKHKLDEENFDEAEAQAYRVWSSSEAPPSITSLFDSIPQTAGDNDKPPKQFHTLLAALQAYLALPSPASAAPRRLPLSPSLPDMKASTSAYVDLQTLYKAQADREKAEFRACVRTVEADRGVPLSASVSDGEINTFVKNAHALVLLRGRRWGVFDERTEELVASLQSSPRETATHLALTALSALTSSQPQAEPLNADNVTEEKLLAEVAKLLGREGEVEWEKEVTDAVGEVVRAPNADLPNTASFLGGLVAQEAIKVITKQYVPVSGYCVVDMVDMWTGVIGGI